MKRTPLTRHTRLRARYRGVPADVKAETLERDRHVCQWCGKYGADDPHHRLRRSQGGKDEPEFLVSVHRWCHRYIHEHPDEARLRGFLVRTFEELAQSIVPVDGLPESIW